LRHDGALACFLQFRESKLKKLSFGLLMIPRALERSWGEY
jgi:hypothetical protein